MAAVVMRTFSSSSTMRTGAAGRPRPAPGVSPLLFRLSGIGFGERGRVHGENDVEGRALPLGARDLDAPAVVADDVLRDPEAEPRALGARREEGLEDARQRGLADAAPRVADAHRDGRLNRLIVARGAELDLPLALDGLLRVQEEVEEDLPELV